MPGSSYRLVREESAQKVIKNLEIKTRLRASVLTHLLSEKPIPKDLESLLRSLYVIPIGK